MLKEKAFDTGETTLNYVEGPAVGPPMVMLHGLTGWWRSWQTMLPQFTPAWHVYAYDLRGHGNSGRTGNHYRVIDYVRDTAAFLRHTADQPAILVGHSFGGLVALGAAAEVPGQVRGLALLDPSLLVWRAGVEALPQQMRQELQWLHQTVTAADSFADVVARCHTLLPEADAAQVQAIATQVYGVAPAAVGIMLHQRDRVLEAFDLAAVLQQVTQPTLILRGEPRLGSVIHDEDVAFAQTHLPSVAIVNISDAGHNLLDLDGAQLELVLHRVRTFLESL